MDAKLNIESREQVLKKLEGKMIKELGIKIVSCEYFGKPLIVFKDVTRHCFAHIQKPRELLIPILESMSKISLPFMAWREDLGTWASIYNFKDSDYGILISMDRINHSEISEKDHTYDQYETIGKLIIGSPSK